MSSVRAGRVALAIVIVLTMAACGSAAGSAAPSASSPLMSAEPSSTRPGSNAEGPLVVVEVHGGECPQGACGGTTVVERDGRAHITAPAAEELGAVPPEFLQALVVEIDQADFEALGGTPFSGECPVHFDGQEVIYTFGTATGAVRLASCEVAIDEENPLFVAVHTAIAAAAP